MPNPKEVTGRSAHAFVIKVMEMTKCTHEQARDVLGLHIEINLSAESRAYSRGYNAGHAKGKRR